MEYANQGWSPHLKKIIAFENVQRRATKMLPGIRDLAYAATLEAEATNPSLPPTVRGYDRNVQNLERQVRSE